jgi:hypothetical protein
MDNIKLAFLIINSIGIIAGIIILYRNKNPFLFLKNKRKKTIEKEKTVYFSFTASPYSNEDDNKFYKEEYFKALKELNYSGEDKNNKEKELIIKKEKERKLPFHDFNKFIIDSTSSTPVFSELIDRVIFGIKKDRENKQEDVNSDEYIEFERKLRLNIARKYNEIDNNKIDNGSTFDPNFLTSSYYINENKKFDNSFEMMFNELILIFGTLGTRDNTILASGIFGNIDIPPLFLIRYSLSMDNGKDGNIMVTRSYNGKVTDGYNLSKAYLNWNGNFNINSELIYIFKKFKNDLDRDKNI